MSFRYRLALFLVVTLVAVQALTAAFAYLYLRHNLVERAKRELVGEMGVFTRQLDFLSDRVTDAVKVASLDYALRAAIAQHNRDTELSALRNHGQRIGATRLMLVGLDGALEWTLRCLERAPAAFPSRSCWPMQRHRIRRRASPLLMAAFTGSLRCRFGRPYRLAS